MNSERNNKYNNCDEILNIHCQQCGAPAKFDIIHQIYQCTYCTGKVKIEDALEEKIEFRREQQKKIKHSSEEFELVSAHCSGCGANLVFEKNEILANCSFCGRSLVRKKYLYDSNLPESIVPFGITEQEAKERLEEWCKNNKGKKEATHISEKIDELKGFYLPYIMSRGPVHCDVYHNNASKKYEFDGYIENEFINCSKQLDNLLLDAMEPYDLSGLEKFDFAYVAGYHVKTDDISDENKNKRIQKEISENYKPKLEKIWGTKSIRVISTAKSTVNLPVLLPVYYINDGSVNAAVNGQTGKVSVRAEKDSHYVEFPWWLKGLLILLITLGVTFGLMAYSGMNKMDALCITGVLGIFYFIVYICMLGDLLSYKGSFGSYRKIFSSGKNSFKRVNGELVLRDVVLMRKVADPIFFENINGINTAVTYRFKSPIRMIKMIVNSLLVIFMTVIIALIINGFDFGRLKLGGSAVWFCITVPTVPIYLIMYGMENLYDKPWIYLISDNKKTKRYIEKKDLEMSKILEVVKTILGALFIPPLCFASWFIIISFCVMCYLTAFGF